MILLKKQNGKVQRSKSAYAKPFGKLRQSFYIEICKKKLYILFTNSHFHYFQNLKCREIGVAEDSIPIVQLYIVYTDEDSGELVTRLINKELVDRGAAQWVEHSSVHCAETNVHSAL